MTAETKISVRLDVETLRAVTAYQEQHTMNLSQAVRILLALALRDETSADTAFRTASFKEGMRAGVSEISKKVQVAVSSALGNLDNAYLNGDGL